MKRLILSSIVLALPLSFLLLEKIQRIHFSDSAVMVLFGLSAVAAALLLKEVMKGKTRFEAGNEGGGHEPGADG